MPYGGSPDDNPNFRMLQETNSNAVHSEFNLAKERDYEKVQQKLYEEFKQLDINNDGSITFEEIVEFLQKKVRLIQINHRLLLVW
jgi:hypothetical protein